MEVLFKMNIRSNMENSKVLFEKSLEKIPGGVNSPVKMKKTRRKKRKN